jgi:radical SAM superfamily enzyme YgiQ (UPF0313 family)
MGTVQNNYSKSLPAGENQGGGELTRCDPTCILSLVSINARFSHSCLALFYLRNSLRRHLDNVQVVLNHFTINDPYYQIVQDLNEQRADFYFFSALIWNSERSRRVIEDLLRIDDDTAIVIGGPQASVIAQQIAERQRVSVFAGDIEHAPSQFYDDLRARQLRPFYQAELLRKPDAGFVSPYCHEDFRQELKNRYVYYESSRGCPYCCTYCLSSSEQGVVCKSPAQVEEEIDLILAHHPPVVRFLDRSFNYDGSRALAIWRRLATYDTKTLFHFEIVPRGFSPVHYEMLAGVEANRFQFEIGLQTTHLPTLRAINRADFYDEGRGIVRRLRELETIHLHVDLILGLPFETYDSFCTSISDALAMRPHYLQMGLLKMLPDTVLRAQARQWGYRFSATPPYSVFSSQWLSGAQMRELYWLGECIEKFYNNRYFVSVWDYLRENGEDMAAFFAMLTDQMKDRGLLSMATTQRSLSRELRDATASRADSELIVELLRFDWLRCGHRALPDHLAPPQGSIDAIRRRLMATLPASLPGVYTHAGRAAWLRTTTFCHFSAPALRELFPHSAADATAAAFTRRREPTVHGLNEVVLLGDVSANN